MSLESTPGRPDGQEMPPSPPPEPTPGYPPAGPPYYGYYAGPMPPATSGWAIASLICSILGIFGFPVVGSILGVVFGHLSLNDIRRANGRLEGRGLAIAGLIIGYASLALAILAIIFLLLLAPVFFRMRFHHLQPMPLP